MVLGYAFGVSAIAVNSHGLRVFNRLGLVHSDDPEKVEAALMRQVAKDKWTACNAMSLHGRETCIARKARGPECVLRAWCEWPDKY